MAIQRRPPYGFEPAPLHGYGQVRESHHSYDALVEATRRRGPRNYRRRDERVREDLCDRIVAHRLDARDVEVLVEDGNVILRGTVETRWLKRALEDLAFSVPGVEDVIDELRIRREP